MEKMLPASHTGFYVINDDDDGACDYFPTYDEAVKSATEQAKAEGETYLVLQPIASVAMPEDIEPIVTPIPSPAEEA